MRNTTIRISQYTYRVYCRGGHKVVVKATTPQEALKVAKERGHGGGARVERV